MKKTRLSIAVGTAVMALALTANAAVTTTGGTSVSANTTTNGSLTNGSSNNGSGSNNASNTSTSVSGSANGSSNGSNSNSSGNMSATTTLGTSLNTSNGSNGTNGSTSGMNTGVTGGINAIGTGTTNGSNGGSANGMQGIGSNGSATGDTSIDFHLDRSEMTSGDSIQVSNSEAVNSQSDLEAYASTLMQSDSNVRDIAVSDNTVSLEYRQPAKLFGFINSSINTTVSVNADGSVDISYPWYRFLASVDDTNLESTIDARVSESMTSGAMADSTMNANARAGVQSNSSSTARRFARILRAIRSALDSNTSASANASASGSTTTSGSGSNNQ